MEKQPPLTETSHHNRNFQPYDYPKVTEPGQNVKEAPQRTIADKLILLVFLLSIVFSGYLTIERLTIKNTQVKLEEAIEKKQKSIEKIEKLEKIRERFQAEKILPKLEDYRIEWSDVYKRITEQETYQIRFDSFQTGRNYQVQVSGIARKFEDISKLITDLKKSPYFEGPFVPNINGGNQTSSGEFTFTLDFRFVNLDKNNQEVIPTKK